jgi:hypothetical protein
LTVVASTRLWPSRPSPHGAWHEGHRAGRGARRR